MNEAKLLKLNYVHNLISAGSFMVTISAMTLIHLGLTAMFTTPYKKKRKNPPSGTPTLLIHQLVLFSAFMESLCDQVLSFTFLIYPFFLQKKRCPTFPRMLFNIPPATESLRLLSGGETSVSASSGIYFSPCCCYKTKYKIHQQQLVLFHSV